MPLNAQFCFAHAIFLSYRIFLWYAPLIECRRHVCLERSLSEGGWVEHRLSKCLMKEQEAGGSAKARQRGRKVGEKVAYKCLNQQV